MKINMIPEPNHGLCKYSYRFPECGKYYGRMNYNPYVREYYTLLEYGEPVLDVRQTSLWKVILLYPLKIWLNSAQYIPQYQVFSQGEEIGRSVVDFSWTAHTFKIHEDTYVLRVHSHNVGSLTQNDRQIARYQWKREHKLLETVESVEIEYVSETHTRVVLAFSLLFEGLFCKGRTRNMVFQQDEYEHLAHWKSQDT